jgi:hypothetical protein
MASCLYVTLLVLIFHYGSSQDHAYSKTMDLKFDVIEGLASCDIHYLLNPPCTTCSVYNMCMYLWNQPLILILKYLSTLQQIYFNQLILTKFGYFKIIKIETILFCSNSKYKHIKGVSKLHSF